MNRNITFRELCQMLENMQFERITRPTHVLFQHLESDTMVVLRPYTAREFVNTTDLGVVRKALDERGLLPANMFEDSLRKKPA